MASSDPMVDGPPTKKAKIGGDANSKKSKPYYWLCFSFEKQNKNFEYFVF